MGSDVTVASTTDTQDEVNQAAGGVPQNEEQPELKPPPTGDQQVESGEQEETPQEAEKHEEEKPKVPRGVEKRIDKLTREKNELAAKVAALEAKQAASQTDTADTRVSDTSSSAIPTEVASEFESFDAWSEKQLTAGKPAELHHYMKAWRTWEKALEAQQEEKEAQQAFEQEIETTYKDKVDAFKAQHDDWDELLESSNLTIPTVVGNAIKQFENGPEVVYYLAKNPKEAQRIDGLPPVLAVAEIGRIAARLEKVAPEGQETNATQNRGPDRTPIVSKAPAPIKPLSGHAVRASVDLNDPNLSYDEYRRIRDQQEKARFRR